MKNVYFVVLDSFIFDKIGKQIYGPTTTPFLDNLKNESINTVHLYSNGPFTEAGATALLTGNDLLNEGGYMHNINTKSNHFIDVFSSYGYEIFDVFHPYFMYSDDILNKIDHQYFSSDFIFNSVFSNRLQYFSTIKEQRSLTQEEYNDVIKQLEVTFSAWKNFLNYSKEDKIKYSLIKNAVKEYDFEINKTILINEFDKFNIDKISYSDSVLNLKKEHPLFKIQNIIPSELINREAVDKYYFNINNFIFFGKLIWLQFWWNIKNNKISFQKLLSSLLQNIKQRKLVGYFKSVLFTLTVGVFCLKYKKKNFLKEMPSFNAHIELTLAELQKRNKNKPFFVKIHPEDLHNRTSIFSYDAKDSKTIIEEIEALKRYFSKVKSNFSGSLIYDMSVVYIDLCIKRLFIGLEKLNLLDDTIVVITSDHGCSYVNSPIRDTFVNNVHTENYRIPLYIYANKTIKDTIPGYYTSKDVLPTIYELCGIQKPINISGKSIWDRRNIPSYAISEYMGGGCPDMRYRDINFIIRDQFYLVAYKVKLCQSFEDGYLDEIYDLIKDINEECNLKNENTFNPVDIQYLLVLLKDRFSQIQKDYKSILSKY